MKTAFDNNANDSHVYGNNLTAVNSPTYTASGKISYAADFETDSDQYFSITDAAQTGAENGVRYLFVQEIAKK